MSLEILPSLEGNQPLISKPVLCLNLVAWPIEPYGEGISSVEMQLRANLRPQYIPLFITDADVSSIANETVEPIDYMGPFTIYRSIINPERLDVLYLSKEVVREERKNLFQNCTVPEMELPLKTPVREATQSEVMTDGEGEVKWNMQREEIVDLLQEMGRLFNEEIISAISSSEERPEYPHMVLRGLQRLIGRKDFPDIHPALKDFIVNHLEPLLSYTESEVERLKTVPIELHTISETVGGITAYDAMIDLIRGQSATLIGKEMDVSHEGFLIPFSKFTGEPSFLPGTVVSIDGEKITITQNGQEFSYSMPQKGNGWEICYKGGVARLLTKIALGIDVQEEIPLQDIDLAKFGKGGPSKTQIAEIYHAETVDIDEMGDSSYEKYCATRDTTFNETLVTREGIFISYNCLSSMYQGTAQVADDNVNNSLFNRHIIPIYRQDARTNKGEEIDMVTYEGKERFPSPLAFSRLLKLLIDGKCEGIVVPKGIRKVEIGDYWLVFARKILAENDASVREAKLERLLSLAKIVHSKFYQALPENEQGNPQAFIDSVNKEYPHFSWKKLIDEKDEIVWYLQKLRNQCVRSFGLFIGKPAVGDMMSNKLTPDDLQPEIITLPPLEAYGVTEGENSAGFLQMEKIKEARSIQDLVQRFSLPSSQEMENFENTTVHYLKALQEDANGMVNSPGRIIYISASRETEFYDTLSRAGYFLKREGKGYTISNFGYPISFVFVSEDQTDIETSVYTFEELYHSSGIRPRVKENGDYDYPQLGFSEKKEENDGKLSQISFFEEAMVGLEWNVFKDAQIAQMTELGLQLEKLRKTARAKNMINEYNFVVLEGETISLPELYVTFVPESRGSAEVKILGSFSGVAAQMLDEIIRKCGNVDMIQLFRKGRAGDIVARREIAKRIDTVYGEGSYGELSSLSTDDLPSFLKIREKYIPVEKIQEE